MQIVFINGKNPFNLGGGYQTYTRNMARLFKTIGYDVHVYCLGETTWTKKTPIGTVHQFGVRFLKYRFIQTIQSSLLIILAPFLALKIIQTIQSSKNNILYGIGPWSISACIAKILLKKSPLTFCYIPTTTLHEFLPSVRALTIKDHGLLTKVKLSFAYLTVLPFYHILDFLNVIIADKIITHYHSAETILLNQFKINARRFLRLPYAPIDFQDKPMRQKKIQKKHICQIISICRQDPRKGINILLQAFKFLNEKNIQFQATIVGEGILFNEHKKLITNLHLHNVRLSGYAKNKSKFYRKADIYASASYEEGSSSLSLLEAASFGLPIVTTNVDGIVEDFTHGKTAFFVPVNDSITLADRLQQLIQNPYLRRKIGRKAQMEVMRKYGLSRVKASLKTILNRTLLEYPNKRWRK